MVPYARFLFWDINAFQVNYNMQKYFNLGLDFRLYSSKFLAISFPYDIPAYRTLQYKFKG